jgi:hypothetical protein
MKVVKRKGTGRRPLHVSFEKSVDGSLLLGDLKVRKSLRLPFDVSDIINSKLSYIKFISYAGASDHCSGKIRHSPYILIPRLNPSTVGLQIRRSSPFTSDGSIPLLLTESDDFSKSSSSPKILVIQPLLRSRDNSSKISLKLPNLSS